DRREAVRVAAGGYGGRGVWGAMSAPPSDQPVSKRLAPALPGRPSGVRRGRGGSRRDGRDGTRSNVIRRRRGGPMITKFDSLYAGHLDMDNIGYGGTSVNSRVFPNERLVTTYSKARNLARLLD